MVTRLVTSMKVLYFANSGVNTPTSSPPFDIVMAETVSKGIKSRLPLRFLFFLGMLSVSRCSNNLLTPMPMGIVCIVDTKLILNKAILSRKPVHVLLVGKPGCAKTMFLTEIMRRFKSSLFVVGSNTTKAGLINQIFEKRPKFLLKTS